MADNSFDAKLKEMQQALLTRDGNMQTKVMGHIEANLLEMARETFAQGENTCTIALELPADSIKDALLKDISKKTRIPQRCMNPVDVDGSAGLCFNFGDLQMRSSPGDDLYSKLAHAKFNATIAKFTKTYAEAIVDKMHSAILQYCTSVTVKIGNVMPRFEDESNFVSMGISSYFFLSGSTVENVVRTIAENAVKAIGLTNSACNFRCTHSTNNCCVYEVEILLEMYAESLRCAEESK